MKLTRQEVAAETWATTMEKERKIYQSMYMKKNVSTDQTVKLLLMLTAGGLKLQVLKLLFRNKEKTTIIV